MEGFMIDNGIGQSVPCVFNGKLWGKIPGPEIWIEVTDYTPREPATIHEIAMIARFCKEFTNG